jgi:hypothetical protein
VEKDMREQPDPGNSAEERSINRLQPIVFGAVFYQVVKHFVSTLNQCPAVTDIAMLTAIGLPHRGVLYISWYAKEVTEQVHRFADVTIDKANGCRSIVQSHLRVFFGNSVEAKMAGELVLLHYLQQDFLLHISVLKQVEDDGPGHPESM